MYLSIISFVVLNSDSIIDSLLPPSLQQKLHLNTFIYFLLKKCITILVNFLMQWPSE